ncbi:SigE family RNA polymerase sigma factor [Ornithinimicrobium sp. F0845]|uniref:SigE family RNA polymerase sigma factor n=1 Tax=Ornithinimicrobium sp. F0845 TaxID=2926412 RepID=UPI001FF6042F|nr:SigE family RNA polymerase sigma factor [Ornithinimicrobium sp. F0845]
MDPLEEEFVAFVRARQRALVRAAYLVCGDHHVAQDLVQEALTKLAHRWERVRTGSPEGFVRRIDYRDAISRWRKVGREWPHDHQDTALAGRESDEHDPVESWIAGADMRDALAQLPPRQRAVLVLRYYEDQSEVQIADYLGISPGTVKSQAHRALATRRELLPDLASASSGEGDER